MREMWLRLRHKLFRQTISIATNMTSTTSSKDSLTSNEKSKLFWNFFWNGLEAFLSE